jgi:hypothetical protein
LGKEEAAMSTTSEVERALILQKAENLKKKLEHGGFTVAPPAYNETSMSATIDVKDFFDGIWQVGVEITKSNFYVYRFFVEPLFDDCYKPDSDVVIDYSTGSACGLVGYFSRLLYLGQAE